MQPSQELIQRVEKAIGSKPVAWRYIAKGYTAAERYVVKLGNGTSVFVKVATDDNTARWLRNEYRIYGALKADFLAKFLAWEDGEPSNTTLAVPTLRRDKNEVAKVDILGERPLLILEDLSAGFWPPPWSAKHTARVRDTLKKIAATAPPAGVLPAVGTFFEDALGGWRGVAVDPSGFLSLGLISSEWLATALPILIKAEQDADFSGDALVHMDVRSDNICFLGERTILVDWNWASVGTPHLDLIAWLPSLHSEGGPAPWDITLAHPELIAEVAGYFASHAYKPPPREGSTLRQLQLAQLKSALPWAARALKLPVPELT